MSTRSSYESGTPSWVDLGSPDTHAAADFYGALFGWTAVFDPTPDFGGYANFMLNGQPVAGLGPQQNTEIPPYWTTYFSVTDVRATIAAVEAAGGTTIAGPMDVGDEGSMAVFMDSAGSFVSAWQPKNHIGARIVNEPGSFGWAELSTADLAAAQAFYPAAFGVTIEETSDDSCFLLVNGRMVAGAHTAGDGEFPAWSVWFTTEDFGRGAVVADLHGAAFGLASGDFSDE